MQDVDFFTSPLNSLFFLLLYDYCTYRLIVNFYECPINYISYTSLLSTALAVGAIYI